MLSHECLGAEGHFARMCDRTFGSLCDRVTARWSCTKSRRDSVYSVTVLHSKCRVHDKLYSVSLLQYRGFSWMETLRDFFSHLSPHYFMCFHWTGCLPPCNSQSDNNKNCKTQRSLHYSSKYVQPFRNTAYYNTIVLQHCIELNMRSEITSNIYGSNVCMNVAYDVMLRPLWRHSENFTHDVLLWVYDVIAGMLLMTSCWDRMTS